MAIWYIFINGSQKGPIEERQLAEMGITPSTIVWCKGMADWLPAAQVPELQYLFAKTNSDTAPNVPPQYNGFTQGASAPQYTAPVIYEKSKVAAGVLAILLGGLGIQYFYLGKIGAGFVTILLSLITCGIWPVLMFAQGIYMLTLTDQEFQYKYVDTDSFMPIF